MLRKYPQFSFGFAIIFFAELIVITNNLTEFRFITKPLITISLILFLRFAIKKKSRFGDKILTGLFFSLLGDVMLMFAGESELYFMLGLGAFLITHLFYIAAFYLDSTNKKEVSKRYILPIFVIFGFFCLAFYYMLQPLLGQMQIPVLVYALVITTMAITAALRYGKASFRSFIWILIGAILFVASDSLLAYNKFIQKMKIGELLVMSTYMLAQFFITVGTVERKYLKKN